MISGPYDKGRKQSDGNLITGTFIYSSLFIYLFFYVPTYSFFLFNNPKKMKEREKKYNKTKYKVRPTT